MTDKWDKRFLELAKHVAEWSKDPSTHVGCVIVGPNKDVRSTGYNGLPRGVLDLDNRMERPDKYLWTVHAEANAVAHAARSGACIKGCTVYVTHPCCSQCAALLINSGVGMVIVGDGKTVMSGDTFSVAKTMFYEADVPYLFSSEDE